MPDQEHGVGKPGREDAQSRASELSRFSADLTRVYEALLTAHDHLGIGVVLTDGIRIVYANDALCDLYGYTQEELRALPSFLELVVEEDRPRLAERLQARLRRMEASDTGSTAIVRKDGRRVDIEYAVKRIDDRPGESGSSMIAIVRDISERRIAEEREAERIREQAMHSEAERFRALIEHSYDVVALLDARGTILYDTPAKTRVLGYEADELIGSNAFSLIHPADLGEVTEKFTRLVSTPGGLATATFRLRHKDGSWRWVDATGSNMLAVPAVNAIVINYRDVTEIHLTHEAQERLYESERKARQLAERGYARSRASYAVSSVIMGARSIQDIALPVLDAIGRHMEWDAAGMWLPDPDAPDTLRRIAAWHAPAVHVEAFDIASLEFRPRRGNEGLVGKARSEGVLIFERDLASSEAFVRRDAAASVGLRSALVIPLRAPGGVEGVIEFFSRESREPDEAMREAYFAIGDQIGQFIERARIARLVLEMSTPVLPISDRLLLVPLTGTFDPQRATMFLDQFMGAIRSHRAVVAVVDVTGVAVMDTYAASQLLKAAQTARLLGCHVILSGVSAAASRSLVTLGVDMKPLVTTRDVEQGLEIARRILGELSLDRARQRAGGGDR
ncbi:MAG: PAS domain S-box protein [Chloroflexi bacterium]|nr:PAS domain S-box protein [Chloroflexota bacterium]